jgi:hypothetical protein
MQKGDSLEQSSVLYGTHHNQQFLHFVEDLTRAVDELNEYGSVLPHSDEPLRFIKYSCANTNITIKRGPDMVLATSYWKLVRRGCQVVTDGHFKSGS